MDMDPTSLFGKAVENLKTVLLPDDPPNDGRGYARAHNFLFDERVGEKRLQKYIQALNLNESSLDLLFDRHERYFADLATTTIPSTFLSDNEKAFIDPLDGHRTLVRVENINGVLDGLVQEYALTDRKHAFILIEQSLSDYQNKNLGSPEHNAAKAMLEQFLRSWVRDNRPVFASMEEDVQDFMAQADWPERLRTRLGLAHLKPQRGELYIALMRYSVKDVMTVFARMPAADVRSAFAAPTVLDSRISAYFFPAPLDHRQERVATYGRAMPLELLLTSVQELLHIKIEYQPDHFCKLGRLTNPIPAYSVRELRNYHLLHLREKTGRETFGEEIP